MECGVFSQTRPHTRMAARSDDPMPVAKQFTAPYVTAWLSAPTTSPPGMARPDSTMS